MGPPAGFEPATREVETRRSKSTELRRHWRCRPVSRRLMTVLQTAAFLFRHCTVLEPAGGIEPPLTRSERVVLPLNEAGIGPGSKTRTCDPSAPNGVRSQLRYARIHWRSRQNSNLDLRFRRPLSFPVGPRERVGTPSGI